jgi:hypothetical protein
MHKEEKSPRGHSINPAIKNDVAEVLLAFFVLDTGVGGSG